MDNAVFYRHARIDTVDELLSDDLRPHDSEMDLLASDLKNGLAARATILARVQDDSVLTIGAEDECHASQQLRAMLIGQIGHARGAPLRGSDQWTRQTFHHRPVDVFRALVHKTVEDGEIFVVSLFDVLDGGQKRDIQAKFAQRRPLATSYLEILHFGRRRHQREFALEGALSTIRTGVVLLDEQANVVFANTVAEGMLGVGDCIRLHRGRLLTTNLRDNVRLTVALQHASMSSEPAEDEQPAPMIALERSDRTSLILLALPLRSATHTPGDAVTILHIVDPKVDFADHVRPLCRIYQLSRTETDLACLLAKGLTLAHAADAMRLKEQTARSTLRSIFYKTGTGRQTELVLLLLSRVVPTSSTLKIESF